MAKYTFHVEGMHCQSCVVLIERELSETEEVSQVKAVLHRHEVNLEADFGDKTLEHVAADLNTVLQPHGYVLAIDKRRHQARWADFKLAGPLALVLVILFIVLQKLGVVNLLNTSEVSFGTAALIGLIASVSTCMAVVGGLVLSVSANFAKGNDKVKPQVLFHLGRLISFFILGGVIGALGAVFQLNVLATFVLSLLVGLVLIILGINLLDLWPAAKRFQVTMPGWVGKQIYNLKGFNHTLTPLILGIVTFFLPCGFTQSMQVYTLTTGSFITGALTMFFFALGTLPVLLLLSFGSLAINNKSKLSLFFKTAGLVVIFFGLVNIINSLAVVGIIPPLINF